MENQLTIKTEK